MSIGGDLLTGVTGNINMALLIVDLKKGKEPEIPEVPQGGGLMDAKKKYEASVKAAKASKKMLDIVNEIEKKSLTKDIAQNQGTERFYFYVQYNPSEMSLTGEKNMVMIEDIQQKMAEGGEQNGAVEVSPAMSTLEFKLYFDEVTAGAAFTTDTFNSLASLNVIDLGKKVIGAVVKGSVKPYVDAITTCVSDDSVDAISFYWSRFAFKGKLNRITADYTMFDTEGRPIRAEVSLTIQQNATPQYNLGLVQAAFDKTSRFNPAGNLLNFNL